MFHRRRIATCLSFAEFSAKCRIAGRRLLGHTVTRNDNKRYQDTRYSRNESSGERRGSTAVADGIDMAEARGGCGSTQCTRI
jgi:hypothetical protein